MLELVTSCRLHFGLLELAADQPHRYGGLGLMVQAPQMRLVCGRGEHSWISPAEVQQRIQLVVEREAVRIGYRPPDDFWLDAVEPVPMHSGLGVGTQLASAVATMLRLMAHSSDQGLAGGWAELPRDYPLHADADKLWGKAGTAAQVWQSQQERQPAASPSDAITALAQAAGRGKRSSIGLQGFLAGGLVRDLGQTPGATSYSPGLARSFSTTYVEFPQTWPIVMLLSTQSGDMYGETEEQLISSAGNQPNPHRQSMLQLSATCMTAAGSQDFGQFVSCLEDYMDRAASLFAPVQAGRYRTDIIRQRVEAATRVGLRGCGQSSWGPTVFGFAADTQQAQSAAAELRLQFCDQAVRVIVTTAAAQGAKWRWISPRTEHAS